MRGFRGFQGNDCLAGNPHAFALTRDGEVLAPACGPSGWTPEGVGSFIVHPNEVVRAGSSIQADESFGPGALVPHVW